MLLKSDFARLEFILKLIDDIDEISGRHDGINNALQDTEGYHALMMCLMQIGESLGKLEDNDTRAQLPAELAYKMRNIIAHDYLGISPKVIISTIKEDLPVIKKQIKFIIKNNSKK
jgi:uncharacterized protein with HEPN domain